MEFRADQGRGNKLPFYKAIKREFRMEPLFIPAECYDLEQVAII